MYIVSYFVVTIKAGDYWNSKLKFIEVKFDVNALFELLYMITSQVNFPRLRCKACLISIHVKMVCFIYYFRIQDAGIMPHNAKQLLQCLSVHLQQTE